MPLYLPPWRRLPLPFMPLTCHTHPAHPISRVQGVRYGPRRIHLERRAIPGIEADGGEQPEGEYASSSASLYPIFPVSNRALTLV